MHRVGGAGRQRADGDAEVTGAGHVLILTHGSVRRPGRLVAGDPPPRSAARGLGRRRDGRDRAGEPGRRDPRGAARRRATSWSRQRRSPTTPSWPSTTPSSSEFLRTAAERWAAGPYADLVGQERVVPYLFPTPAMTAGLPARPAVAIHADAGRFAYDTMTLVGPGTWEAARSAVDCAIAGRRAGGRRGPAGLRALPPARPPRDAGGLRRLLLPQQRRRRGRALRAAARVRVGIVDLDAHQGNGTAAIFYARADVRYGSVHVDPGAGWFPHVVGYADETGTGPGEGATRNLPAARGHRRRGVARGRDRAGRLGLRLRCPGGLARCRRREGRPGEPAPGHRGRLPRGRPAARRDRTARRWSSRRAATTCPRWVAWSRRTSTVMDNGDPKGCRTCPW